MLDTPLPRAVGKLGLQGVDHGLVAIGDPEPDLFDATCPEIVQEILPGLPVLPISYGEAQRLSLTGGFAAAKDTWFPRFTQ